MQKYNHYHQLLDGSMEYSHSILQHPWYQPNKTKFIIMTICQKKESLVFELAAILQHHLVYNASQKQHNRFIKKKKKCVEKVTEKLIEVKQSGTSQAAPVPG